MFSLFPWQRVKVPGSQISHGDRGVFRAQKETYVRAVGLTAREKWLTDHTDSKPYINHVTLFFQQTTGCLKLSGKWRNLGNVRAL